MTYTPVFMRHFTLVALLLIAVFSLSTPTTFAQISREYSITPSLTDPAINDWNSPHLASSPGGTPRNVLLVHFAGTGGTPQTSTIWYRYAASLGFHVIGLTHSNDATVASLCQNSPDSACYENVRLEIINGTDLSPQVSVSRANSIENRLIKLLQYLQRTAPASENWGQFLTAQGTPVWSSMIISGHSQGGGHAAMLGRLYAVQRVIQFASVADYSNRFNAPAFWISKPKATPSASYFGLGHPQDESVPWARLQQNWSALGLTPFGGVVNVDSSQPPYNNTRQTYTRINPAIAGQFHGSMIVNPWMPLGTDSFPTFKAAWQYLLTGQPTNGGTPTPTPTPTATQTPSWTSVYTPGRLDANGQYMGGNEIIHLIPHKGRLYAGNSYWQESNNRVTPSCEILSLDAPNAQWRVDRDFTADNVRMNAMKSVVFTTDSLGNSIRPDTVLMAVPTDNLGQLKVYTRNDANNTWTETFLSQLSIQVNCRAIGNYLDPVTKVHKVFLGLRGIGIIAGSYSPSRPGKIKWETSAPEFSDSDIGRFTGFTTCNGKLYCSADKDTLADSHIGQIYERTNGATPSWKRIFVSDVGGDTENTRGLTGIPSPSGIGEELIFSWKNIIRRVQPLDNYARILEASLIDTLERKTGYNINYVLAAYNDFFPFTLPSTGEKVLLVGFETQYDRNQSPLPSNLNRWSTDGKYLIRRQNGNTISYELQYIVNNTPVVKDTLVAVRTFCVSPFASDSGKVLYAGGYDCNSIPSTNQAWIYKGDFRTTPTAIRLETTDKPSNVLTLYPNPANDLVVFEMSQSEDFEITVTNVLGASVLVAQGIGQRTTLDVSSLPSGMYFLKLQTRNQMFTKPLHIIR